MSYRENNNSRAVLAFLPNSEYHAIGTLTTTPIDELLHVPAKTRRLHRRRMAKRQGGKFGDFLKQTFFPSICRVLSTVFCQTVMGSLYFGKRPLRETQAMNAQWLVIVST